MGMADVNRAFSKALGTVATSGGCTMNYERDPDTGKQRQRLQCNVILGNQTTAHSGVYPGEYDLTRAASELAASVVEHIKGGGQT